jgi:hydrogenase-4 membrane subunit HyfE
MKLLLPLGSMILCFFLILSQRSTERRLWQQIDEENARRKLSELAQPAVRPIVVRIGEEGAEPNPEPANKPDV